LAKLAREDVPEEGFSEEWRSFFEVRIPRLADDIVRIEEINFIVSIIISKFTPDPPKEIQELVENIRIPSGAGDAHNH